MRAPGDAGEPDGRGEAGAGREGVAGDAVPWNTRLKAILETELRGKGVTYAELVEKLAAVGIKETESNIRN